MSRDDDARRFAEAMPGCEWIPGEEADTTSVPWSEEYGVGVFRIVYPGVGSHEVDHLDFTKDTEELVYLPAPDAPLHEHLGFCGRVFEAIKAHSWSVAKSHVDGSLYYAHVYDVGDREGEWGGSAPDPSWAAMLAAIAAKGAK